MTSDTVAEPLEVLAELLTPESKPDPYRHYDALWAHGPVFDFGAQVVLIGFDECSKALRDPRLLSIDADVQDQIHPGWEDHSAWRGLTRIMLFRNGATHDRLRRFLSPAFTSSRIAAMRPVAERHARADLDRLAGLLAGGDPVDLVPELGWRYPMNVLGEVLGIPEADRAAFRKPVTAVANTYEPTTELSDLGESDAAMDWMSDYLRDLAASRRSSPADDLTTWMVRAQAESRARAEAGDERAAVLDDEELLLHIMLLIVGGTEAPMDVLGKAIRLASETPELRAGLLEGGPEFASDVFEETMRHDSPVHTLIRVAGTDVDLPGVRIRKGTRVTLVVGAANRDPRRFPEANRFDPSRADKAHLTFSAGGHFCLGAALARLQAQVLLPLVFETIPGLRPAGPPTYRNTIVQHGYATNPFTLA